MNLKQRIADKRQQAEQGVIQSTQVVDRLQQEQQDPDAVVLLVSQIEVKKQGRRTFENLDTLAEVHFRLGDRDTAVRNSRRAVDLRPDSETLKKQLHRFQGDPLPDSHPL